MKIELWVIGKSSSKAIKSLVEEYVTRCNRYSISFNYKELDETKGVKKQTPDFFKNKDADRLLKLIKKEDHIILMDERGKGLTSIQFSKALEEIINSSNSKRCIFIIGGAYGFSEQIYARANRQISLSNMTFPHQLARVMILEQIYRGLSIIRNEKYHH